MSEVMVDYGYAEALQETRSGYSGRSSTYTQAVSSTADRSGTEMVETDHYIGKNINFRFRRKTKIFPRQITQFKYCFAFTL